MALTKASALRLTGLAMQEGAVAVRGRLSQGEGGEYRVGDRNLSECLTQYEGREVIVILAPVDNALHAQVRQCGVCGRDYEGDECPFCAKARARLRGRGSR